MFQVTKAIDRYVVGFRNENIFQRFAIKRIMNDLETENIFSTLQIIKIYKQLNY